MGARLSTLVFRVLLPESSPALVSGITVTLIALVSYSAMAGVIIGMANTLGLKLVAEGIENQAQCDWLLNAGVSIAQGYLFSRALTLKEFDARYLSSANQ